MSSMHLGRIRVSGHCPVLLDSLLTRTPNQLQGSLLCVRTIDLRHQNRKCGNQFENIRNIAKQDIQNCRVSIKVMKTANGGERDRFTTGAGRQAESGAGRPALSAIENSQRGLAPVLYALNEGVKISPPCCSFRTGPSLGGGSSD